MNHPWKFGGYFKAFLSYWSDVIFQNGCLAAILDFDQLKFHTNFPCFEVNHPWKPRKDISKHSRVIGCRPGSHIGFPIRLKLNLHLPWIEMNHPWKFGKGISRCSWVIGQTLFSKWLPGSHIGFPIGLKFHPNLSYIDVNHPWKCLPPGYIIM